MADRSSTAGRQVVAIPFPRTAKYGTAEKEAVCAALEDGHLSDIDRGPRIAAIEDAFTALTGAQHALSFNSGTASLHAALHGVGAGPHAGVVVSPMTWVSAITAVLQAGSYPVFCDIEQTSPNLSADSLAHLPGTYSAVLATHAWGIPARMDDLADVTKLPIVEDCSHAHGAVYRGRPVGSWGAAGCFSLQESKSVSGGEGGVMTTSDRQVYERALTLGHHPRRLDRELTLASLRPMAASGAAYKFRMPVLSAVIATEQLRGLPGRMKAAEANFATLCEVLASFDAPITVPTLDETSVRGGTAPRSSSPSASMTLSGCGTC
ncbi:DegT/DnrJ/EryC1/StrS family aminotransferase [Kitasatospora acidiphila]|uniref:DegT/DnrJ/EryC1/StrS family aminotransferase n=1 Tax=Kitasatospora acidiphila TaxID=2567942 RepID=UPI0015F0AED4|nr:DegT/DnrJ/EryC1/StrS family aminotransferase [Kitasatospora acidiphila]